MTRTEYLDANTAANTAEERRAIHRAYVAQYVSPALVATIAKQFGIDRLRAAFAEGPHMNAIPLAKWDDLEHLTKAFPYTTKRKELGEGGWTLSFNVCVLKEAARQAIEQAE